MNRRLKIVKNIKIAGLLAAARRKMRVRASRSSNFAKFRFSLFTFERGSADIIAKFIALCTHEIILKHEKILKHLVIKNSENTYEIFDIS